jgi:hypothetical protein
MHNSELPVFFGDPIQHSNILVRYLVISTRSLDYEGKFFIRKLTRGYRKTLHGQPALRALETFNNNIKP